MGTLFSLSYGLDPLKPYTLSFNTALSPFAGGLVPDWDAIDAMIEDTAYAAASEGEILAAVALILKNGVFGLGVTIYGGTAKSWVIEDGAVNFVTQNDYGAINAPSEQTSLIQRAVPNAVSGIRGTTAAGKASRPYMVGLTNNLCATTGDSTPLDVAQGQSKMTPLGSCARLYNLLSYLNPVAFSTFAQVGFAATSVRLTPEYRAGVRRS